ncbi:DUF1971 domain-containing protein [Sorangium sp. So ce854]|uniref:DUF1971 domain-containing protein n=1 Tax=Sorangium sp. So ce854 TaxID=3133322 RepID=UPI003F62B841
MRAAEFGEGSILSTCEKNHATRPGVSCMTHIVSGRLRHRIDEPGGREMRLDPERPGLVAPEVLHPIDPDGPALSFVEFHRNTG